MAFFSLKFLKNLTFDELSRTAYLEKIKERKKERRNSKWG
jgi:hypothetical protein